MISSTAAVDSPGRSRTRMCRFSGVQYQVRFTNEQESLVQIAVTASKSIINGTAKTRQIDILERVAVLISMIGSLANWTTQYCFP